MTTILDFLPYYPSFEDDEQIYSKKEFNELKLSKNETKPTNQMYQKHQELLSKILSSYTLYDKLLLFHSPGTGKTGVAFATSERILSEKFGINKVFVLTMSNDVLVNLKSQLVNTYGKDKYIPKEREGEKTKKKITEKLLIASGYNFMTFHTFAKEIKQSRDKKEEESLLNKYSNSVFILDEIHNIKQKIDKKEENDMTLKKYNDIKFLLRNVKNSKILLMTGTPMRDSPDEIIDILNLIVDKPIEGFKLTDDSLYREGEYNTLTLNTDNENIKKFLKSSKGFISYLKEDFESTIKKEFIGEKLHSDSNFIITRCDIVNEQKQMYLKIYNERKIEDQGDGQNPSLSPQERQCALGCFKTKKGEVLVGKDGFARCIEETFISGEITYKFKNDINLPSTLEGLKNLSMKYYKVLKCIKDNPKQCHFVFSELLNGSGIIFFSLLLNKYLGYNRQTMTGSIETKAKRYILLSGETSIENKKLLIKEFNEAKNCEGEYVQVILGTDVVKEGLNFFHIQHIHILTGWWNFSKIEQVIARGVRYASHDYLKAKILQKTPFKKWFTSSKYANDEEISSIINKPQNLSDTLKNKLKKVYNEYENDIIKIKANIYLYTCYIIQENNNISIDYKMYRFAEEKDRKIKAVEHLLKQCAIDCELFKERNKRHPELDFTRNCEFQMCDYDCIPDLNLTSIDYTTYNLYYYNRFELITIIKKLFKLYFYIRLESLQKMFMGNTLYDILYVMSALINEKIVIENRFGIHCHIQQENDIFFLVYITDVESTQKLSVYYNENVYNEPNIPLLTQDSIIQDLEQSEDDDNRKRLFQSQNLDKETKFELLTKAIQGTLTPYSLQEFIKRYLRYKYFDISINGINYYVVTLNIGKDKDINNMFFLKGNEWVKCNEDDIGKQILKLYEDRELEIKTKANTFNLGYYGLIDYDNDKDIFKLKKIQDEETNISKQIKGQVCTTMKGETLTKEIEKIEKIEDKENIKIYLEEYKKGKKTKRKMCEFIRKVYEELDVIFYETYNNLTK